MNELLKSTPEQLGAPEYSYGEGLSKSIAHIIELLKNQPYVVVAFSASGRNVGKSTLAKDMQAKLFKQGYTAIIAHHSDDLKVEPDQKQQVFILDQMQWGSININAIQRIKTAQDRIVKIKCEELNYNINGIDLWIGIYTPNQPFATEMISGEKAKPIADIIIRNTEIK